MKIIDLQGIGPAYAKKLISAGIRTAETLLKKGGSAKGRKEIAAATGISDDLILRWVNHADLCRVKGIGPQFAELLEKAGVDSVAELSKRLGGNLYKKLVDANRAHKVAGVVPSAKQVEGWIAAAKNLPKAVSH